MNQLKHYTNDALHINILFLEHTKLVTSNAFLCLVLCPYGFTCFFSKLITFCAVTCVVRHGHCISSFVDFIKGCVYQKDNLVLEVIFELKIRVSL